MLRITELKLPLDHPEEALRPAIVQRLGITDSELLDFTLFKRSYDARKKSTELHFIYTIDCQVSDEAALLHKLAHWHETRLAQGFTPIRNAWLRHGPAMGAAVSVKRDGALLQGAFAGLSPEGALMLAKDSEVQLILAGEII